MQLHGWPMAAYRVGYHILFCWCALGGNLIKSGRTWQMKALHTHTDEDGAVWTWPGLAWRSVCNYRLRARWAGWLVKLISTSKRRGRAMIYGVSHGSRVTVVEVTTRPAVSRSSGIAEEEDRRLDESSTVCACLAGLAGRFSRRQWHNSGVALV